MSRCSWVWSITWLIHLAGFSPWQWESLMSCLSSGILLLLKFSDYSYLY